MRAAMDHDQKPEPEIMPPQEHEPMPPKSFLVFVAEQGQGAVANEMSHKLRDLTEEIERHFEQFRGKVVGEIHLKIRMTLERGMYKVDTEYAVKFPKAPANATMMWLGHDGNLQTENPKQLRMPFAGIPGGRSSA